jgi:hypothetical protein
MENIVNMPEKDLKILTLNPRSFSHDSISSYRGRSHKYKNGVLPMKHSRAFGSQRNMKISTDYTDFYRFYLILFNLCLSVKSVDKSILE